MTERSLGLTLRQVHLYHSQREPGAGGGGDQGDSHGDEKGAGAVVVRRQRGVWGRDGAGGQGVGAGETAQAGRPLPQGGGDWQRAGHRRAGGAAAERRGVGVAAAGEEAVAAAQAAEDAVGRVCRGRDEAARVE
ncbi:choice-of-anchor A domain containing protein [Gracilaria domingensis]|nr:choice-of-anchor A domain containing protein [Gracilaria domingensis]